jgi:hypothetical protein
MNIAVKEAPRGRTKNKTTKEARRLGISKPQLLFLYHTGVVPGVRVSERIILFDPDEVDEALREHSLNQKM